MLNISKTNRSAPSVLAPSRNAVSESSLAAAPRREVVIVGGGAGGLKAAQALRNANVNITLVNKGERSVFQPLLFKVADGTLDINDISVSLSEVLGKQHNANFIMSSVVGVDVEHQAISLENGTSLPYDYLVVAAGARTNYFGHESDWGAHSLALKTAEDAVAIRAKAETVFANADNVTDPEQRKAMLTFAFVGGGPIGMELAGIIAERARRPGFKNIRPGDTKVTVISGDPVLSEFGEQLSQSAARQAQEMGIELRLGSRATGIEPGLVRIGDESLPAATIIWAAGVRPADLAAQLPADHDRAGHVLVENDSSLAGHPNIFAIGDIAAAKDPERKVPGLWTVATQAAEQAAKNILHLSAGEATEEFRYHDPGSMAFIGSVRALLQTGGFEADRFPAWAAWTGVHVLALPTTETRLRTGMKLLGAMARDLFLAPYPPEMAQSLPEATR